MLRTRVALTALATLLLLAPTGALACGLPLDALIVYEQALLIVDGPRQQLVASVELRDAEDAAVIFPVPGRPEAVDQPAGGAELFGYLKEATAPVVRRERRLRLWGDDDSFADSGAGLSPGVDVLGEQTLGGYEVARLASTDAGALQAWLADNGYTVPPAAAPILAGYVADGWSFVAVRLSDSAPDGSLAPLRISYSSDEVVYPMRLGALSPMPVTVDLFVLDAGRAEAQPMGTRFAGPVAGLDPAPGPEVAAFFAGAPYLTHLRAEGLDPQGLDADFAVGRAASDEPFREERVVYDDVYLAGSPVAFALAITCMMAVTPLSLVAALFIKRRLQAVGGPPPAE